MVRLTPDEFEALVAEALDAIPEEFQRHLENTLVTIEAEPSRARLEELGVRPRDTLLGLYTGTPLPQRDANFAALPDTILRASATRADAIRQVRDTVVHEIGHFFGLSDADLP
jgi:predicted Zn-dependent protease with MMP-like domain